MKHHKSSLSRGLFFQVVGLLLLGVLATASWAAPNAYVANSGSGTVSVIDTATDAVVATVTVGTSPDGVAVSPDGSRVYVASSGRGTVSVIDTATDTVAGTVNVGTFPVGVAVSPDGSRVYVANLGSGTVSVIDTATDTVAGTVNVGTSPVGVAVSPDGSRVYVANENSDTVSVIDTATDTVAGTVNVGTFPVGVAVSPDGSQVYVADDVGNTVSVIDTATDTVAATVAVGTRPLSLGAFVGPGALIATNSSASGSVGAQITASVPALADDTTCEPSDFVVQAPTRGGLYFDSNGAFTYTPSSATYSGPDAFTWYGQVYPTCEGADNPTYPVSNVAAVSLTIDPLLTGLADTTLGESSSRQEDFGLTGTAPFSVSLTSSDPAVLPISAVTISSACGTTESDLNCTLNLSSGATSGTSSLMVTATDAFGDTVTKTNTVTVAAPPTVSGTPVSIVQPKSGQETLTLTGTGTLTVSATSTNPTLLPSSGITGESSCTAAGSCVLTLEPAAGQTGTATVTVTVSDRYGQTASGKFTVSVVGSATSGGGGGGGGFSPLGLLVLAGLLGLETWNRRRVRGGRG